MPETSVHLINVFMDTNIHGHDVDFVTKCIYMYVQLIHSLDPRNGVPALNDEVSHHSACDLLLVINTYLWVLYMYISIIYLIYILKLR